MYTLITGASSGIGASLAAQAAADGRSVILVGRNQTRLASVMSGLNGSGHIVIRADVSQPGAASRLAEDLEQRSLDVDILINCAGFGDSGDFAHSDATLQESMIAVNITALTLLTRHLLPSIIQHKGYIMNVGSVAGFIPGPYMSTYFASKAYVLSFSEALDVELRPHEASVTCLAPGPVATDFAQTANVAKQSKLSQTTTTPDEVAAYGWRSMMQRKTVAVYGNGNRVGITLLRLLPRRLIRYMVGQGKKRGYF